MNAQEAIAALIDWQGDNRNRIWEISCRGGESINLLMVELDERNRGPEADHKDIATTGATVESAVKKALNKWETAR